MRDGKRLTLPTPIRMQEEAAGETWGEFFDAALAGIEEPGEGPAEVSQRAARWLDPRRAS